MKLHPVVRFSRTLSQKMCKTSKKNVMERRLAICDMRSRDSRRICTGGFKLTPPQLKIGLIRSYFLIFQVVGHIEYSTLADKSIVMLGMFQWRRKALQEQTKHGGGGGGQAIDHKQWLAPPPPPCFVSSEPSGTTAYSTKYLWYCVKSCYCELVQLVMVWFIMIVYCYALCSWLWHHKQNIKDNLEILGAELSRVQKNRK